VSWILIEFQKLLREIIKLSAKESLGYAELKKHKPWFDDGMLRIITSKETSQIAVGRGFKQSKWG
jgi:hypothetical protein